MSRIDVDEVWDAGDMGCGELVLELRTRLARASPCRMHPLVVLTRLDAWTKIRSLLL